MITYNPPEPQPMELYEPIRTKFDHRKPSAHEVDRLLPSVPFSKRPRAYKFTIALIFLGVGLSLGFVVLALRLGAVALIITIIIGLFILIGFLGIVSIILLLIPKKIGWHFAMVTAILALLGLGLGTIIGLFTIITLLWPSTRYYFRTGEFPRKTHIKQHPYPQYPMMHLPFQERK